MRPGGNRKEQGVCAWARLEIKRGRSRMTIDTRGEMVEEKGLRFLTVDKQHFALLKKKEGGPAAPGYFHEKKQTYTLPCLI